MIGYKDRYVQMDYPSEAYYHFRKHCFSIVQDDLVVLHSDVVVLKNVEFTVSEASRQRVLREQVKNVHARVLGTLVGLEAPITLLGFREAYYNPYKTETFIDLETREPLWEAEEVILIDGRIFYI